MARQEGVEIVNSPFAATTTTFKLVRVIRLRSRDYERIGSCCAANFHGWTGRDRMMQHFADAFRVSGHFSRQSENPSRCVIYERLPGQAKHCMESEKHGRDKETDLLEWRKSFWLLAAVVQFSLQRHLMVRM
jgi:hypothetical protein